MINLGTYKYVAATFIFATSLLAAAYPFFKKNKLGARQSLVLGEAFASGVFLGAALFHLLPESIFLFNQQYPTITYPIPEAICGLGILFFLWLEQLLANSSALHAKLLIPYLLFIMLSIHALVEGTALGLSQTFSEVLFLFIAIAAHKGSESFAICVTLLKQTLSSTKIAGFIILFALMTPIGIGLGMIVHNLVIVGAGTIGVIFNAFAAGTFLYIATLHHSHTHRDVTEQAKPTLSSLSIFTFGLIAMATIAIIA